MWCVFNMINSIQHSGANFQTLFSHISELTHLRLDYQDTDHSAGLSFNRVMGKSIWMFWNIHDSSGCLLCIAVMGECVFLFMNTVPAIPYERTSAVSLLHIWRHCAKVDILIHWFVSVFLSSVICQEFNILSMWRGNIFTSSFLKEEEKM